MPTVLRFVALSIAAVFCSDHALAQARQTGGRQVLRVLGGMTGSPGAVRTWDRSSLATDGTLEVVAPLDGIRVVLRGARIGGDLIVHGAPLEIDLSEAVVTGSVWIIDWPAKQKELIFPVDDVNGDKYPEEDREGCWRIEPTGSGTTQINAERLRARNLFVRYSNVADLRARHAVIDDTVSLDYSSFRDFVDFGFAAASHAELVGASFNKGLGLQSMRLNGNVDLTCVNIGGPLNALDLVAGGYVQMVGLTPIGNSAPAFDLSFSRSRGLSLRGVHGHFAEINLTNADLNVLELDWDHPETDAHPSLRKPWLIDRVLTRGSTIRILRPSQREREGTLDRVGVFGRAAVEYDDRIYRKFAEAYARDGDEEAANDAWARYSAFAVVLHLPVRGAVVGLFGMLAVGTIVGRHRLKRFYQGARPKPGWDAFLLTFELMLPGIIDLGVSKRHDGYLKQVSGVEEATIVAYRLLGWTLGAAIAAHLALSLGS